MAYILKNEINKLVTNQIKETGYMILRNVLFSMIFHDFLPKNAGVNKKRIWIARIV